MISGVLKSSVKNARIVEREIREEAASCTDERVAIVFLGTQKELEVFLQKKEPADIICVDVSVPGGIAQAELLRKSYPKAAIIVIADAGMSPVAYMKPTILAAALLLEPLSRQFVRETMTAVFEQYITREADEEVFVIETREEKHRVPLRDILYFESREKRIYACTQSREYGFYDTMDQLSEQLKESFIRCHRSYMVNLSCIDRVMVSKNLLTLKQGIELPLSRSYKNMLKQLDL